MAIGAATLDVNSNNYNTLRYTTAAAALADNDSFTVGLVGAAGATVQAPAAWAGNGTNVVGVAGRSDVIGATGQTEDLTDDQRTARTLAFVNYMVDPTTGAGTPAASFWVVTKGGAPWRLTFNYQGEATAAGTTLEFVVHFLWSPIR